MADEVGVEQIPSKALLWLEPDTAEFVGLVADREYGGDRAAALNGLLRSAKAAEQAPEDPWAYVSARVRFRPRSRIPGRLKGSEKG